MTDSQPPVGEVDKRGYMLAVQGSVVIECCVGDVDIDADTAGCCADMCEECPLLRSGYGRGPTTRQGQKDMRRQTDEVPACPHLGNNSYAVPDGRCNHDNRLCLEHHGICGEACHGGPGQTRAGKQRDKGITERQVAG